MKQEFTPALKVYKDGKEQILESRDWNIAELGARQIEEVWKFYAHSPKDNIDIYVSNLGYVAKMNKEDAERVFGKELSNFQSADGQPFRDLNSDQKKFIRECNFVPANKKDPNTEIWLYVEQISADVHKMVAEKFLKEPADKNDCCVHHIDNNSYNNNVTNLIWLKKKEHQAHQRQLHPLSF